MLEATIPGRLLAQGRQRPHAPAYYAKNTSGTWEATSWSRYADEVRVAARALGSLGFAKGEKTCILGFNRPEWVILDHATMLMGGAPAGIYTTCSPSEVAYIVNHTEARILLLEDHDQWSKILEERDNLPNLEHVILMDGAADIDDEMVLTWNDFLARADAFPADAVDERLQSLKGDEVATLIYTSGTTGPPKGVMLSHDNLAWTAQAAIDLIDINDDDCAVSYLPLSHIAEQMFSLHAPATTGYAVYFAESLEKVPDNFKEVQPTVLFAVPRIWEKFYAGVSAKMALATGVKAKLVTWARAVGEGYHDALNTGGTPGLSLRLQHRLANKLIYSKVKPALGLGRARFCVSGAAPISPEILRFFSGLDVVIREVYGQSEETGPTSFNREGATLFGSVGPSMPGVEVNIAEDGEILVRGPNVFMGYYKDQAATDDALKNGWLQSGDLGRFDKEGFLHITGRKKDIIITAGGKNVAPKNWEAEVKNMRIVGEAVMIGDKRKFLSSLISLDPEAAAEWADAHGTTVDALPDNSTLRGEIQAWIDGVNKNYARVEQVKKFTILARALSIEDGELTPTLKVKRAKVSAHFADEIEAMYAE